MRFTFLGTAASEGYPNAFCGCENCEQARAAGGPSLRKRSAALIDDELVIDLGPDLMAAAMQHGISLAKMRYCIQTHEHADHLDPSHLHSRSPMCGVLDAPRLHYYASPNALRRAARILRSEDPDVGLLDPAVGERLNVNVYAVKPFQHFEVGPYQVYSVRANHAHESATQQPGGMESAAMLYVIERAGRVIFYGTDTGEMPEETWEALAKLGKRADLIALDHTFGFKKRATTHLNAEQFQEQMARLFEVGVAGAGTRIFATHIAHHSNPTHPELAAYAAQHGYEVAYDGLVVEL